MRLPVARNRDPRNHTMTGAGLLGLALLLVNIPPQRAPVQAQESVVPKIRLPDPVSIVPASPATTPADQQLLVPPAPQADVPGTSRVGIPVAPQTTDHPASSIRALPLTPPTLLQQATPPERTSDADWTITITPLEKPDRTPMASRYEAVYHAIPFRRAEYLANPSYRHDTTIEFLFGQMRQMVINRNDVPQRVVNSRPQQTQPYPLSKGELYSYWPLLQYSYPLPRLSPIQ